MVNLHKIKTQIDQRIQNIKDIIQRKSRTKLTNSQSTQTLLPIEPIIYQQDHALQPSNKHHPNLPPLSAQKGHLSRQRMKSFDVQGSTMLESNGFTFRGQDSQRCSTIGKVTVSRGQTSMENQIPQSQRLSIKVRHTLSPLHSVNQSQSYARRLSMFSDVSNSAQNKTEMSIQRYQLRSGLRQKDEPTVGQFEQKRVVISEQCFLKIQSQVSPLLSYHRRQLKDPNLRTNLLRRIQEKYSKSLQI